MIPQIIVKYLYYNQVHKLIGNTFCKIILGEIKFFFLTHEI